MSQCIAEDCKAGEYLEAEGCAVCPEAKQSPTGSTDVTQCMAEDCNSGEYMADDECIICPKGTMSPAGSTDVNQCIGCEAGKYMAEGNCLDCAAGTTSQTGSNDVTQCVAEACAAGKYRAGSECVVCPEGKTSPAGSTTISDCEEPQPDSRCVALNKPDMIFQECPRAYFDLTCDFPDFPERSPCYPRCACPNDRPILFDGKCIKKSECPNACPNEDMTFNR